MKKRWMILLVIVLAFGGAIFAIFQSMRIDVSAQQNATLNYWDDGHRNRATLDRSQTDTLIEILDGKIPCVWDDSCGFYRDDSIVLGDEMYCLAEDGCPSLLMVGRNEIVWLTQAEYDYVIELFEEYR